MTDLHLDISIFRMPAAPHRSDNIPTLLAGHSLRILRGDTFNLSPVSSFTVTRIAGNHTIFVQEMQVLMCLHLDYSAPHCAMFRYCDYSQGLTSA
jgi:hypothetical protein